MSPTGKPVGKLGTALVGGSHACAFFDSDEEEYRLLLPFVRDCLDCGEKCLHFVDPSREQDRLRRLAGGSIDTEKAMMSGQLEVRTWEDSTLRGRRFDQDEMLALIEDTMASGRGSFPRSRLWANMEWSLSGLPGCDQLIEFESRLNTVLDASEDIVLCVYDVRRYSASAVMDILCTHPMVIIGEFLQPNPVYVPPHRFLAGHRRRRGIVPQ